MKKVLLIVIFAIWAIDVSAQERDSMPIHYNLIHQRYRDLVYDYVKAFRYKSRFPFVIIEVQSVDSCRTEHSVYFSENDFVITFAALNNYLVLDAGEIHGIRAIVTIRTSLAKFVGSDLISSEVLKKTDREWSKILYDKHKIIGDKRIFHNPRGVYFDGATLPFMKIITIDDYVESVTCIGCDGEMTFEQYVERENDDNYKCKHELELLEKQKVLLLD